jgi:hypothetical protein
VNQKTALLFAFGAAILLLVGLGSLPLGYYTFIRWGVTGLAVWLCFITNQNAKAGRLFLLVPVAILFNPIALVYLSRPTWAPFDTAAAFIPPIAAANLTKTRPA